MPRTSLARLVAAAMLFFAMTNERPATAQSTKAAAETLFDEGRRLVAARRFAEACPKFVQSQQLDPAAGTLLNLADCYEKAGRTASAWLAYTDAVVLAEKSGRAEWAKTASAKAAALRPELPTLTIRFPEPLPAGLEVTRDGELVAGAEAGLAVPVDPGDHVIEARAPGRLPFNTTISVVAKDDKQISVPPLRVDPRTAPTPTSEDGDKPPWRTLGFIGGGVGLAGIGVGAVAGILALGSKSRAADHCSADLLSCDEVGVDAMARARGQALVSTIAFAVGGALLVGGALVVLVAPPAGKSRTSGMTIELRAAGTTGAFVGRF